MRKVSTLRALLLVSVFTGALLLSAEAAAESHLLGGSAGRGLARPGSGNVPGVCDPVSNAPVLPLPAPRILDGTPPPTTVASAKEPENTGSSSAEKPKKKKNSKPKSDDTAEIKTAKADSKPAAPVEKPKPEELAKLSPKDKLKALLKGNGCTGCHSEQRVDNDGNIVRDQQRIAEIILGTAKDYSSPDDTMESGIVAIRKELGDLEKDVLKGWAAGQK